MAEREKRRRWAFYSFCAWGVESRSLFCLVDPGMAGYWLPGLCPLSWTPVNKTSHYCIQKGGDVAVSEVSEVPQPASGYECDAGTTWCKFTRLIQILLLQSSGALCMNRDNDRSL